MSDSGDSEHDIWRERQQREDEASIRWTGDEMARLIWRCLECGATGTGETADGIAAGNDHRHICPRLGAA